MIDRALQEHGELQGQELAQRIGARYWGPGRFRDAIDAAVSGGVARRSGRNRYAPARTAEQE